VDCILGARRDSGARTESSFAPEDTFLRLVSEIEPTYALWQIAETRRADHLASYFSDRLEILGYAPSVIEAGTDCVGAPAYEKSLWVFGQTGECTKFNADDQINRRLRNACEPKKYTAAPRVCRANERPAHRVDRLEAIESGTIPGMAALLASIFGVSLVF
jgi:hypothetical protein